MAGRLSGVAKRMLDDHPKAHFVHCMAHCINLCLQDVGSKCVCVKEALSLASDLANVVRASPKRLALFQKIQNEMAPGSPRLKPLCTTRWTVRTEAINAILKNYAVICCELEQISREGSGEITHKACGLLALMDKFSVFFGLKLSHLVFAMTEQLSITLQSKDITAQEATNGVNLALRFFHRQRCDTSFAELYKQTLEEAKDLTQPPVLPRVRKASKRLDSGSNQHVFITPEDYFRKSYYEVVDMLVNELNRRFQHPSFTILHQMEDLMITSCNNGEISLSDRFCSQYASDLDIDKLKIQLFLLPDLLRTVNEKQGVAIHKVTSIRTIIELKKRMRILLLGLF